MEIAARVLTEAGFERYEVASYARPGFACRHNIAYWTGVPYLGLGRSAATMTQNAERRMRVKDGAVTDDLDARQMAAEDLMLGMRMTRGVSDARVERAAGLLPRVGETLADLKDRGWSFTKAVAGDPRNAGGFAATSCTGICSIWLRKRLEGSDPHFGVFVLDGVAGPDLRLRSRSSAFRRLRFGGEPPRSVTLPLRFSIIVTFFSTLLHRLLK